MGGLRFIVSRLGYTLTMFYVTQENVVFWLAQSQSLMTVQRASYPSTHIVSLALPFIPLYTLSHLPPPLAVELLCPENGIVEALRIARSLHILAL